MKRSYLLPFVAILGVAIAILVIIDDNRPRARQPLAVQPSESPYVHYIAGTGIVEAISGNVEIGTPVAGVVIDIYVDVGDRVTAGDELFKIDDRDLQADLLTAIAKSRLAETIAQKPEHRLEYLKKLQQSDVGAVNARELSDLQDDVVEAQASIALAKAQVNRIRVEIARHTIRAPADGKILQLHTRVGEYVEGAGSSSPLLIFGRGDTLYVRVNIDETVAWRFQQGAEAVAYVRGNPQIAVPLKFAYKEPFVIPKRSLSGWSTERTDVRVLQVLYSLENPETPVFVGQQLDVFIETDALSRQGKQ